MALGNLSPVIVQRASAQNPAFGLGQLRSFTPIFNQKATEVRNIWLSQLNESQTDVIKMDIPYYMNRATLDIIGLAGQGVVCDVAVAPLTQVDPRRLRLRVRLSAVQERRTQQCLQCGGIQRERVYHSVSLHLQTDPGDARTRPPQSCASHILLQ